MDKDNSFYGKCTRAVAWLLIPATLVVGGLVTAAVAPVHPQGGQAQWDEPKPAVRPADAPVSVGDQIPTVSVEDLPKAKPEPKKAAPKVAARKRAVDCSNAKVRSYETLQQGSGGVLFCHD